jgi:hypothetical protein
VLEQWRERIAYISAEQRDVFRISKALRENDAEAEADQLALQWMNDYLKERNHPDTPLMTPEEIERAQARNRDLMNRKHI